MSVLVGSHGRASIAGRAHIAHLRQLVETLPRCHTHHVRLSVADIHPLNIAGGLLECSAGRVRCHILLIVVGRHTDSLVLWSRLFLGGRRNFGRNFGFQIHELLFLLDKGLGKWVGLLARWGRLQMHLMVEDAELARLSQLSLLHESGGLVRPAVRLHQELGLRPN